MSVALFGYLIRVTAIGVLWYALAGLLVYGFWTLLRLVPPGRERQTFVGVVLVWWLALAWQLVIWLWWLVCGIEGLVRALFNPDSGPIAKAVSNGAMWLRHWRDVLQRPKGKLEYPREPL